MKSLPEPVGKEIVEDANKTEPTSSSSICICRVPEVLHKLKESAYTPSLVSIGPLHCDDKHNLNSSAVDNIKMSYVKSLLRRSTGGGSESDEQRKSTLLMECLNQMSDSLDEAKKCYAEEVDDQLDEEMLVIDGCFILELLYRNYLGKTNESTDPIFSDILTAVCVRQDLLLLENQLPFFVLQKLFDLTVARNTGTQPTLLTDYVISFFGDLLNPETKGRATKKESSGKVDCRHILHILYNHYHPDVEPSYDHNKDGLVKFMPCASDLKYAGVKFVEASTPGSGVELKVRFIEHEPRGSHFEIPTLCLYDSTEPFLRNLIAFEQCCPDVPRYFTSYAFLMETLINTPKDVQVVEKAGIIQNYLGSIEDASNLFNNLCKEIVLKEFYFAQITPAAADYSKRCWPDTTVHLRPKYFAANPWTFVALCAGFITFGILCLNLRIEKSECPEIVPEKRSRIGITG